MTREIKKLRTEFNYYLRQPPHQKVSIMKYKQLPQREYVYIEYRKVVALRIYLHQLALNYELYN